MIPNILILAESEQFPAKSSFNRVFKTVGEYVEGLSHLYSALRDRTVDIILIADQFPGINATVLRKIRIRAPFADIVRIVWSDHDRDPDEKLLFDGCVSLAQGAQGVAGKIKQILARKRLLEKYGMIGLSEKLKLIAETIDRIAPTDISVLISGPSGAGKELVARAIHENSKRQSEKYVAVNCGALAEGILESELFGHEKGAFTGSVGKRDGLFKQADGGTIFLDEIAEIKIDMQVKLLRVLEDGIYYPVGGDKPDRSDVRVIAATNRELSEAIHDGLFREDLYFRLSVVKINIPSLYDRRNDIIPLLFHFAKRENVKGFSESAIELLVRYDWPGNVRQIRNFVARMAALHPKEEVSVRNVENFITEQGLEQKNLPVVTGHSPEEAGHELIYHALLSLGNEVKMLRDLIVANLPDHDYEASPSSQTVSPPSGNGSMQEMERELIASILKKSGGNRKEAARHLGIGERTLYRKLKKYNLS
jgi:DNA-binding NtrC family response regulator